MFNKLSNSWELVKASGQVLLADKELLIFPAISSVAAIIVILSFMIPFMFTGMLQGLAESGAVEIVGFLLSFLFYAVLYTVTFFFNSALVGAALIRLDGGDPTVADGFRIASKHFGAIVGYALIAATVGTILRAVSEKSGALGRFVISLIGLAWTVATFLVVPVLVVEGTSPLDAIKRSTSLLQETWGEQIAGNFGIGTFFGLLYFVVVSVGMLLMVAAAVATESGALILTVVGITVLSIVILGLVQSALSGIYTAAIYKYATTGEIGFSFNPDQIKQAFKEQ